MDELKNQLTEKLGLDENMSSQAIEMVVGFLKDKLPGNIGGMLDGALSGEGAAGAIDAAKDKLGGRVQ